MLTPTSINAFILHPCSFLNLPEHQYNGLESSTTSLTLYAVHKLLTSYKSVAYAILMGAEYCFDGADDVEVICC